MPRKSTTAENDIESTDERPDECECSSLGITEITCWACYRAGYDVRTTEARR